MESSGKVQFGYWGIRGLGQVPRLLLEYTETPYDEKRYSNPDDWKKDSQDLLNNKKLFWYNLPYLVDGDFAISESKAIEDYIIRRSGKTNHLLGKDS